MDRNIERSEPLVVNDQSLDFRVHELRVLPVRPLGIQLGLGILEALLEIGFLVRKFQPSTQDIRFLISILLISYLREPGDY